LLGHCRVENLERGATAQVSAKKRLQAPKLLTLAVNDRIMMMFLFGKPSS
jgi:hypothetical protein